MDRVSVIIPAYNREAYLGAALESVRTQTRPADEIIVVDDGSTDRTAEVARSFAGVTCISQANLGLSGARNTGIGAARGDLLAFLDSDDLWLPRKLELQLDALHRDAEADLVFCHVRMFRSPELTADEVPAFHERDVPGLLASCLLARRTAFDRAGLFDRAFNGAEFIAWFGRAQEARLRHHMLPESLVRRRVHRSNMNCDRPYMNRDYLRALKTQLARRRAAPGSP